MLLETLRLQPAHPRPDDGAAPGPDHRPPAAGPVLLRRLGPDPGHAGGRLRHPRAHPSPRAARGKKPRIKAVRLPPPVRRLCWGNVRTSRWPKRTRRPHDPDGRSRSPGPGGRREGAQKGESS